MIEPQSGALLARICETLEQTVLNDMAAPFAQRQLKASLWTLRDLAVRMDAQPRVLSEDIADMEQVLESYAEIPAAKDALDAAGALTDVQRHLQLQACTELPESRNPTTPIRVHFRVSVQTLGDSGDPHLHFGTLRCRLGGSVYPIAYEVKLCLL
jgi:hypothetical protein